MVRLKHFAVFASVAALIVATLPEEGAARDGYRGGSHSYGRSYNGGHHYSGNWGRSYGHSQNWGRSYSYRPSYRYGHSYAYYPYRNRYWGAYRPYRYNYWPYNYGSWGYRPYYGGYRYYGYYGGDSWIPFAILGGAALAYTIAQADNTDNRYYYNSSAPPPPSNRPCHIVHKIEAADGYQVKMGATMCYDANGTPYIVTGSEHVIEELR